MLSPIAALERLSAAPAGARVLELVAAMPGAWVVGGAVRDAFLDRDARELDLVVEGDPAALIGALGGSVVAHERFGTATVTLDDPGAVTVDIARARTETYSRPGALPEVAWTTVADDLKRRDVSVNAIALRPSTDGGTPDLLAVDGALEDLEAGVLRVLHDASFRDDPTRLWRLARYATRLGFTADEHTATLAAAADPYAISGTRMGNEVRLALREPDPLAALRAAAALNAGLLVDGIDLDPSRLPAALALLDGSDDIRIDLLTLAACARTVDAGLLVRWLNELGFSSSDVDIVGAGSRASTHMPLAAATTPSQIARAARGVPLEVVALAGGDGARRWIDELRHVHLEIGGEDLIAAGVAPGPELGRRLQTALDQRLDGTLAPGREAELEAALA